MNKGAIVVIVLVVLFGGFILFNSLTSDDSSDNVSSEDIQVSDDQPSSTNSNAPGDESGFDEVDAEDVAAHNTADDCWTIIDGKVYDITSYIPRHPGGDEILRACGGDGSTLFNQRQTESGETVGSGTSHSSNAESQLAPLQIGILVE